MNMYMYKNPLLWTISNAFRYFAPLALFYTNRKLFLKLPLEQKDSDLQLHNNLLHIEYVNISWFTVVETSHSKKQS